MDFDTAIQITGYGKFHFEILAVCAISLISVGFQNGLTAYIFPAAQCELNLDSLQMGLLNVSFLIGGTLSSFLWGILADFKGRKYILVLTHLLNASVTILLSLNRFSSSLIICRFFNGFLIGGPGSIIFSYLAEFQPPKYRSAIVCYSGLFFTSSWLLLPLLSWLVLSPNLSFYYPLNSWFTLSSWRMFMILLSLPEIVAGLWLFFRLPESPKFFLENRGNEHKALKVLSRIYYGNSGKKDFPVKKLRSNISIVKLNIGENEIQCRGKNAKIFSEIWGLFKILFQAPLLRSTVVIAGVMFTNMLGVFGLGLWLPDLFIRFERFNNLYPNETASLKKLSLLPPLELNSTSCTFDQSTIKNTIAMGLTSLVANACSGYLATQIPLKIIPLVTMLIGGLGAGSIYFLRSSLQNLIVASLFQATMVVANMSIGSLVVDLFPTNVGALAICFMMFMGRIGAMCSNVIFGFLVDSYCEIPVGIVASGILVGAVLCFFVPTGNNGDKGSDRNDKMGCVTTTINYDNTVL